MIRGADAILRGGLTLATMRETGLCLTDEDLKDN